MTNMTGRVGEREEEPMTMP